MIIFIILGLYRNIALFFSFEEILKEPKEINCIVKIVGLKEEKTYVDKYTFTILDCKEIPESKNKKFMGYMEKEKNYKPGDIVQLKGVIQRAEEARNLYGFNQRNYLKQSKIYGIMEVETSQYIKTKKDMDYILGTMQSSLKEKVHKLYSDDYANVVNKILFGMSGNIDEEITTNFRDAGISHVLAISGLHISYIVVMINFVLEKIISDLKMRNRCICVLLIFFVMITGASPSCVRACIMNILYLIAQNVYRKNNIYMSIGFAFGVILFSNIYVVYNVGMWLSFLGTLGIVLFHPFLRMIYRVKKNTWIHKVIDIVLVSVSAQILLWPVVLYYFNTVSFTFFVSNICISFLIGPIIILGYFSVIFSYLLLPIAKLVAFIEEVFLQLLFFIADICSKIPFSTIYVKGTNEWVLILYYSFICGIVYYYYKNRFSIFRKIILFKKLFHMAKEKQYSYKILNKFELILCEEINILIYKILNRRKQNLYEKINKLRYKILYKREQNIYERNKRKEIFCISVNLEYQRKNIKKIILICTILILIVAYCISNFTAQDFKLYFVDVGQGDCCIIQVEGKNIIIDSGEGNSDKYDYGKNVVFQHLLKLGINKIDYMIFSHMDSDHARRFDLYFTKYGGRRGIDRCTARRVRLFREYVKNS